MAETIDVQFKKRFAPNLVSNIILFALNIVIGLLLVPFFLDTLGQAAYGIVPLATSVTTYVILIINALNTTISRFLTIAIQKNDPVKANKTFNTAIFGSLAIILIFLPFILQFAWFTPDIFDIGDTAAFDVFILFALVFGSALVRTWGSNFMVVLFAYNRLDRRNYVNITNAVMQVGVVILLFILCGPSLPAIGFSYFLASITSVILAWYLSRNTCSLLKITPKYFSKSTFKEIASASVWITFNDIGFFVRLQIATILVNLLFGPSANTEYSLAVTWSVLIGSIGSLITSLFTPMIYSYYSKNDNTGMIKFSATAIKITGLLIALCIGLVCIFASNLLTIWVGEKFAYLGALMCIVVIPAYFTILEGCAGTIFVAHLKIKIPTIMNIITGGINILLAITLASAFNLGLYGIAIASFISIFLYSVVFKQTYGAYVAGAKPFVLTRAMIPGFVAILTLLLAGFIYTSIIPVTTIFGLIVSGVIISLLYGVVLTKFVFNSNEKTLIRSCIPKNIEKLIPKWVL